jgi:Phage ABA sandwich domain
MDKSEIEALVPGKLLDKIVAEMVMGWTDFRVRKNGTEIGKPPVGKSIAIQSFSTKLVVAWAVVEKLGYLELSTDEGTTFVTAGFTLGDGSVSEIKGYMTVSEAICKAALLAKMVNQ